jgi:hypothetical protein
MDLRSRQWSPGLEQLRIRRFALCLPCTRTVVHVEQAPSCARMLMLTAKQASGTCGAKRWSAKAPKHVWLRSQSLSATKIYDSQTMPTKQFFPNWNSPHTSQPKSRSQQWMYRERWSPDHRRISPATDTCSGDRSKHHDTQRCRRSCQWSSSHRVGGGTSLPKPCAGAQ